MEAVQVISVVFFDKNVFIVIMCDFFEICCKDIFFYLFKQVFFYKKIVSLNKIGCIRKKHSSKLDVFSLICTIFAT